MRGEIPSPEGRICCWVVGLEGPARQFELPITRPLLVGRGPYNHIVLDDARLSRQHARLSPEVDGYVVRDLNSVNGTFVNGVPVTVQALQPNDVIQFGPYSFRVEFRNDRRAARGDRDQQVEPPPTKRRGSDYPDRPTSRYTVSELTGQAALGAPGKSGVGDLMQLESEHRNFRTLVGFVQALGKTINRKELLELITSKIRDIYPIANVVGIHLRNEDGREDAFRLAHSFVGSSVQGSPTLPEEVAQSFSEPVIDKATAILAGDSWLARTRGMSMYVPLIDRDEAAGVIQVSTDVRAGAFNHADLDLLSNMAELAAIMLQTARMYEISRTRDRLNRDLELAAQIQRSFLPREVLSVEGYDFFAVYRAAYTVGGDFYDVFWVAPNRLGIFIGDISGKGVSAALIMARISSELRATALAEIDPVAVLSSMNKVTLGHQRPDLFFTAIYMTLDVSTGEVTLANAGHPAPYLCSANGRIDAISAGAASAVGIFDNCEFKATSFKLNHGDRLVMYTDGVIEAANAEGELFGSLRLEGCLASAGIRSTDIAENILESVTYHGADGPSNDDITLFITQRSVGRPASLQPRRGSGTMNRVRG